MDRRKAQERDRAKAEGADVIVTQEPVKVMGQDLAKVADEVKAQEGEANAG